MTSIYDLKPAFQDTLRPLVRHLADAGVTANQITVAALALSLAHGTWVALSDDPGLALMLLPVTLFLRMALNAIDGLLAREHDQRSRLGALLNELGDLLSDLALYLPLALLPGLQPIAVVAAVVAALLAEFSGVAALLVGSPRDYGGPMGKSDRAFVFGLFGLLFGLGVVGPGFGSALAWVVAGLGLATAVNRAHRALRGAA